MSLLFWTEVSERPRAPFRERLFELLLKGIRGCSSSSLQLDSFFPEFLSIPL